MTRVEWPTLARILAWILAVSFVIGAIVFAVFAFELLGHSQEFQPDFIEGILDQFEVDQARWPLDFAGAAMLVIGFLALAGLGPVMGRLTNAGDARRGLLTASFLGAGGLGAASQLLYIGVKPVATSTQYCDCGLLAEEIMARLMILNVAGSVEVSLISGALITIVVGLVVAGTVGREAGMPAAWLGLSLAIAALAPVAAILALLYLYPFDVLLFLLVAGLLVPIWAVWLAVRARDVWPPEADDEVEFAQS